MAFGTQSGTGSGGERIAKLLARAGVASRREVERMIAEGRVAVNGTPLDTPATVLASLDGVTVDGRPVAAAEAARLFLYSKPNGLLVTERDPRGRPTIYDRLPGELPRVVPVGRLDLNTEGLLLLTTDGGLKRQLELPATGVERTYRARAYGQVTQAQLEELIEGVEVEGVRYGRIDANLERRTGANVWIELTLTEGKNREVRRVLEHLGLRVGRLIRVRYGPFLLGDLEPGEVAEVRARDVEGFRANPRHNGVVTGTRIGAPPKKARRKPLAPKPAADPVPTAAQPAAQPAPASPRARRAAAFRQATGRPEPGGDSPREKPKRKAGWAKAKPRPGPKRPRGPRR